MSAHAPARLPRPGSPGDLVAAAALCAILAAAIVIAAAAGVALLGFGDELRRSLAFGFGGLPKNPSQALQIALHNAKFTAAILTCAVAAPRLPRLARPVIDMVLASLLVVNAGTVGVAIGAYGARALIAVAPHLPVEFAALSLAGGAYLSGMRQPLGLRGVCVVGCCCAALLAAAALLETYLQLGLD